MYKLYHEILFDEIKTILARILFTFGRVRYVGVQRLAVLIVRVAAVVHAQRTQAQIMIYRQKQTHVKTRAHQIVYSRSPQDI